MSATHITTFPHLRATRPTTRYVTMRAVVRMLSDWSRVVSPSQREWTVPLWSPVKYREGATRSSDGVDLVNWLVLDYDDGTPADVLRERWKGWVHIGHTSYSHMQPKDDRPPMPALRIALPLLEPVSGRLWSPVMRAIMQDEGREADRKCIDPARMFYVPCVSSADAPRRSWVHMPAGDIDGPWLCLAGRVGDARAQMDREEAERQERLRKVAARARDVVDSREGQEREIRRRLLEDPRAREDFGHMVGGHTVEVAGDTSGALIRHVECPSCGDRAVWWPVEPRAMFRAACNHRNTCGWRGHLWELAALHGVPLT